MRDPYADQPGTFIVDPEAGIRVPAEDWDLYQFDKPAYLNDKDAAAKAFANANKKTKPSKAEVSDAQL